MLYFVDKTNIDAGRIKHQRPTLSQNSKNIFGGLLVGGVLWNERGRNTLSDDTIHVEGN